MSSNKRQSLLQYLTETNPKINLGFCIEGNNNLSRNEAWLWPRSIVPWVDFKIESLEAMYGGSLKTLLNREFPLQSFSQIPQLPFCEIYDEDSLESLIVKWNQSVVSQALLVGQKNVCEEWTYEEIYMVKGGQAKIQKYNYRPDWAAFKRPKKPSTESQQMSISTQVNATGTLHECNKSSNVLPGDTKLSTKWDSSMIVLGDVLEGDEDENWIRPLKQVFTYCVKGNARYGYLITDHELVVIRVRPGSTNDAKPDSQGASFTAFDSQEAYKPNPDTAERQARSSGIIEYKAIPWAKCGGPKKRGRTLTVNLALWWLHMMAAKDNSIAENYAPLRNEKLTPAAEDTEPDSSNDETAEEPGPGPSRDEVLTSTAEAQRSFGVSEMGNNLASASLGQSPKGSFRSSASGPSNGKASKRTRDHDGNGQGKRKRGSK